MSSTENIPGGAKVVSQVSLPVVEITPALAAQWLKSNSGNRKLRRYKVESYKNAMLLGQWRGTREPIEFSEDGRLVNGQHRLAAVVASGITIQNPVRMGVPESDVVVMDTGLARMASDVLSMDGIENANIVAAAAKIVFIWRNMPGMTMLRAGNRRINNESIHKFVQQNPSLVDSVAFANKNRYKNLPPSAMAAIHYEIRGKFGEAKAEEFLTKVAQGYGLEPGDPILALRNVLDNSMKHYVKPPTEMRIALVVHAFNKWAKGEKNVKIIKHTKAMEYPTLVSMFK